MSPHGAIVVFPIDGALNQLLTTTPIGNRNAASILNVTGACEEAGQDTPNIKLARAAWGKMRRLSTGGTWDERIHASYGENYRRLVAVKSKWDPDNLFRMNKNIAPGRVVTATE